MSVRDKTEIELGDPLVISGTKYRVRGIESAHMPTVILVAAFPARRPTHRVYLPRGYEWDRRVGVFRCESGHRMAKIEEA